MTKSKRRDFLRNSALAGLLAPVAMYWRDLPEARAQDDRTNLILIGLPNGTVTGNPYLNPGSTPSFATGFEPYNAFADRAIAFREYGTNGFIDIAYHADGVNNGHGAQAMTMFTGDVPDISDSAGRAPSVDQIIAWDYLNRSVIPNPIRKSLNIRMTGSSYLFDSQFIDTPADYSLGATYSRPLPNVTQLNAPQAGFEMLFGDLAGIDGGATVEELWAYGKSVLDIPAGQIVRVQDQLPNEGRMILEEHLQSLRELEISFADTPIPEGVTIPEAPGDVSTRPDNHEAVFSHWVRIIDAAIRLDRTRLINIQFGGSASRFNVPSLGLGFVGDGADSNSGSDHHSYTHWRGDDVPRFMNWYAERVAELLGALQGGPTRRDVLAQSAVMVGMEFGHNHRSHDVPVTLFGECGGYFQTGQVLTYGNDVDDYPKHTGTLLALAHAMGVTDLERVGHPDLRWHNGVTEGLRP